MLTESEPLMPTEAQRIIDAKIATRWATIRELRTRRNARTPIAKLPIELLSKIFILTKLSHRHDWLNVTAVCRQWREIVLSTPRLWADFNITRIKHFHWAMTLLQRSKNVPLHVDGGFSYTNPAILRAVFAHITRIRELHLVESHTLLMELFSSVSCTLPTQLQVLHLENRGDWPTPATIGLTQKVFNLQMPFLRDLALCELTLPSVIPPMPQLRRLRISSSANSCETSLSALLVVLCSTPSLEELEIENSLTSEARASDCTEVHLPKLSWVSLLSTHPNNACLFRYIHYPPSSRVRFHCTRTHPASIQVSTIAAIVTHFTSSDVAARMDKVALLNSNSTQFHLQGFVDNIASIDIKIGVSTQSVLEAFRLHASLPSSNVRTLVLGGFANIERADWLNLFAQFQYVRGLVAESVPGKFFSMLTRLDETDTRVSLPRLETILVRECSFDGRQADFSLAVQMVEFFCDRDELGKPIKALEIQDCRIVDDTVAELSDEVDVKWDHKGLSRDERIDCYGYASEDDDPWHVLARW